MSGKIEMENSIHKTRKNDLVLDQVDLEEILSNNHDSEEEIAIDTYIVPEDDFHTSESEIIEEEQDFDAFGEMYIEEQIKTDAGFDLSEAEINVSNNSELESLNVLDHDYVVLRQKELNVLEETRFGDEDLLEEDDEVYRETEIRTCEICCLFFENDQKLQDHISRHDVDKRFYCVRCFQSFENFLCLKIHRKTHETDNVFSYCDMCNQFFEKEAYLKHKKNHECDICRKFFLSTGLQERHKQKHLEANVVKRRLKPKTAEVMCEFCSKCFKNNNLLVQHQLIHKKQKKYHCDRCQKDFTWFGNYHKHMQAHDGLFKCNICEKSYSTRQYLQIHIRTHFGVKPFPCDQCGAKFKSVSDRTRHKTFKHMEKRHFCQVCFKKFGDKSALRKHSLSHTGEKRFICKYCDKKFQMPYNLKVHLRIHTGERPFSCDVCDKRFRLKCILETHIKQHERNLL